MTLTKRGSLDRFRQWLVTSSRILDRINSWLVIYLPRRVTSSSRGLFQSMLLDLLDTCLQELQTLSSTLPLMSYCRIFLEGAEPSFKTYRSDSRSCSFSCARTQLTVSLSIFKRGWVITRVVPLWSQETISLRARIFRKGLLNWGLSTTNFAQSLVSRRAFPRTQWDRSMSVPSSRLNYLISRVRNYLKALVQVEAGTNLPQQTSGGYPKVSKGLYLVSKNDCLEGWAEKKSRHWQSLLMKTLLLLANSLKAWGLLMILFLKHLLSRYNSSYACSMDEKSTSRDFWGGRGWLMGTQEEAGLEASKVESEAGGGEGDVDGVWGWGATSGCFEVGSYLVLLLKRFLPLFKKRSALWDCVILGSSIFTSLWGSF